MANEPQSTQAATQRVVKILDAIYKKADLQSIVSTNSTHLSLQDQNLLRAQSHIMAGHTQYPNLAKTTIKELNMLCDLGVLEFQPESEWASPSFITAKQDRTVCFLTEFREVNKRLVRKPFPLPKISTVLQELEGFTYATTLDLNVGYYTTRLAPDSSKICTLIFP
eukprot:CCRYP_009572-RA/>CCRYP_009572-RA protein AED:0.39 eAED:0.39 QI:0/0/0/1/0/0/2/0/165